MSARQAGATTLTQQSENFGYSAVRLRRIAKLQFGIINPAELVCYVGWLCCRVSSTTTTTWSATCRKDLFSTCYGCCCCYCVMFTTAERIQRHASDYRQWSQSPCGCDAL